MADFDWTKQSRSQLPPNRVMESGRVDMASVSGQTFKVATKLSKVVSGFGITVTDGLAAKATTGAPTNGQITFTRIGSITTSDDDIDYIVIGI